MNCIVSVLYLYCVRGLIFWVNVYVCVYVYVYVQKLGILVFFIRLELVWFLVPFLELSVSRCLLVLPIFAVAVHVQCTLSPSINCHAPPPLSPYSLPVPLPMPQAHRPSIHSHSRTILNNRHTPHINLVVALNIRAVHVILVRGSRKRLTGQRGDTVVRDARRQALRVEVLRRRAAGEGDVFVAEDREGFVAFAEAEEGEAVAELRAGGAGVGVGEEGEVVRSMGFFGVRG